MKAKKSLGQNFLTAQSVVDKIVETANLNKEDIVLEVGPGKGVLTKALLEKAGKVIAVEKDDELITYLKEEFKDEIKDEKLILVHGDILTFDFKSLLKVAPLSASLREERPFPEIFKIVANIPYYITGEFLRKTLSSDIQPTQMVLLVQKEVAERIAKSKKESILSLSVKVYGEPKYIQTVKAGSFSPAPKVDSAILSIENISKDFFLNTEVRPRCSGLDLEKCFFKVIKTGFAHKRKLLINNLSVLKSKEVLQKAFSKANIGDMARAEDLALEQWKQLV
ncbi:MAG: ribosomal RNA small subunit methyltransferase A [Parcubacteria group bacterium]|nr:ribosomal RNA small subunit methyltransferase A [Parcubacteria group bacterium]